MFTRRLLGSSLEKSFDLIKKVYAEQMPTLSKGLHMDLLWRYKSMGKTLDYVTDTVKLQTMHHQAAFNLNEWAKERKSPANLVEVIKKDWGLATLQATKKYGKSYAVLNMANSVFPGGGCLEGLNAQEENIWHRSTCIISLLDEQVIFDESSQSFCYNEMTTKMLEAKIKMSNAEHLQLKKICGSVGSVTYKAFFSRVPRICFRGPEVQVESSSFVFTESHIPSVLDTNQSYFFLPRQDIFPFYELRSAAPSRDALSEKAQYRDEIRRRIESQLDTLILEGQKNVILGAWGCGVFKNDPEIVAEIYREEIEKRADFFEHIVFAIINSGRSDKYAIFERKLNHIKLRSEASESLTANKPQL